MNSEASYVSSASLAIPHVAAVGPSSNSAVHSTSGSSAESSMIKLVNSVSNECLIIELRQLNDPDALWQRRKMT